MDNLFEDAKREYMNRYSDRHGLVFADDYESFVSRLLTCIMNALNGFDDQGHRILDDDIVQSLRQGLSPEEWQQKKAELLKVLFFLVLDRFPFLKHEFAMHLYNELRRDPSA